MQCFSVLLELLGSCFVFCFLFWNPCRCGIRPYAAVGDASWPGHGRPAPKATMPTGPVPTPGPVLHELSDDSDDRRARARPRAMERTRAKTLSPRSAREKRFFPDQQAAKEFYFLQVLLISLGLWILVLLAGALTSWQWFSVLASECSAASASVKFMLFTYFCSG